MRLHLAGHGAALRVVAHIERHGQHPRAQGLAFAGHGLQLGGRGLEIGQAHIPALARKLARAGRADAGGGAGDQADGGGVSMATPSESKIEPSGP
jgi:hypothetical protein